jgi:hypothetical protein
MYIGDSIDSGTQWAVFEPNSERHGMYATSENE